MLVCLALIAIGMVQYVHYKLNPTACSCDQFEEARTICPHTILSSKV